MTIEQYEYLTGNAQLSALLDITFCQLALAVVNVRDGRFFKDKVEVVEESSPLSNLPSEHLNWERMISKKGETRLDHINKHSVPNPQRLSHGVFNENSKDIIDAAWKNKGDIMPIDDGMGGKIYNIPYQNAGYESGSKNTGAQMNYVTIIVMDGTNDLITAFPSFGTYK